MKLHELNAAAFITSIIFSTSAGLESGADILYSGLRIFQDSLTNMPEATDVSGSESPSLVIVELTDVSGSGFSDFPDQPEKPDPLVPRIYKYAEVETQFEDTYLDESVNSSAVLDMIAVYLKGQKILYTEAKTLCELRLNYLMLPAIFITALCSILSLILKDYGFGSTIVSVLNGGNAFILALVSYLKLDARAESHRTSAYKFDKIQAATVFSSGRVLFAALTKTEVIEIIDKVEKDVAEIKESNQFVLPELIRVSFPHIYGTNVFAEVKSIMNYETMNIDQLRNILNDRDAARVTLLSAAPDDKAAAKLAYDEINQTYRDHIRTCIAMRERYKLLDSVLETELSDRFRAQRRWSLDLCGCLKN